MHRFSDMMHTKYHSTPHMLVVTPGSGPHAAAVTQESSRINARGELVVTSSKTRSQHKNLEDAFAKIHQVFRGCIQPHPPMTERKCVTCPLIAPRCNTK